jgi:hypothetical protein
MAPNNAIALLLSLTALAAVVRADVSCNALQTGTGCGSGNDFRQKDVVLHDELEAIVRRIYHDFETINVDDFASLLAPSVSMCILARFNFGCYNGIAEVKSYVSLVDYRVAELLRLWSMTPIWMHVDIIDRVVSVRSRWDFFSFPLGANATTYMMDTITFDCNNKVVSYSSIGDELQWTRADIPAISDHNVTRMCAGTDQLSGIQQACPVGSIYQQYSSVDDCIAQISAKPAEIAGLEFFGVGDSIGCRDWHLGLARFDPAIHCPHVGPTGGGKCTNNFAKRGGGAHH